MTLHFSKHCKTGKNYIAHISPKQNKRKRIGFIKCNNTEEEKKKEEISYVASSTEWLDDFCESIKLKIKIQFKDDDFFYSYTYENIIDIDSFILIITNHFKLPFCPQFRYYIFFLIIFVYFFFRYWNEKGDQEALTTTMVLQNLINAKAKQDEIIGRDSFLKIFVDFALPK